MTQKFCVTIELYLDLEAADHIAARERVKYLLREHMHDLVNQKYLVEFGWVEDDIEVETLEEHNKGRTYDGIPEKVWGGKEQA